MFKWKKIFGSVTITETAVITHRDTYLLHNLKGLKTGMPSDVGVIGIGGDVIWVGIAHDIIVSNGLAANQKSRLKPHSACV